MSLRKLIDIFVPNRHDPLKLDGIETWMVQWTSRQGQFSADVRSVCQAFTSKQDAKEFAESLRAAFRLVKNSSEVHSIDVRKA